MSEEKKIKVVLLEPGKLARTAEIGTSLEDLQKIVDGLIEAYYPFEERRYGGFHLRPCLYLRLPGREL